MIALIEGGRIFVYAFAKIQDGGDLARMFHLPVNEFQPFLRRELKGPLMH